MMALTWIRQNRLAITFLTVLAVLLVTGVMSFIWYSETLGYVLIAFVVAFIMAGG